MRIALKVDVDTLKGTTQGVPALCALYRRYGVGATFLFSLGPDHTGRAIRRVLRPGFMRKVGRTSVTRHYGYLTLLYGTLLPGPDIARRAGAVMRMAADNGFETGVHTYDHVRWQDGVCRHDARWAGRQMQLAVDAFNCVFGRPPRVHGAAGWQINPAVPGLEAAMDMDYASDTRGREPFMPVVDGTVINCPQLPTTLPTLDELLGRAGWTERNVDQAVLAASQADVRHGHVYTLHAELEGGLLLPAMERLIEGWLKAGHELVSLRDYQQGLNRAQLPRCCIAPGQVPGRAGDLALQSAKEQS